MSEIEEDIDGIVEKHYQVWYEENKYGIKKDTPTLLKLVALDAYKAGMEAARKVFHD